MGNYGRNPFLSRAGFDKEPCLTLNLISPRRNPFLSRAGFDKEVEYERRDGSSSRNPFLSRAGFDRRCSMVDKVKKAWSQSLFK